MSQKVNATGFRMGVNKTWKSRWFQPKKQYAATFLNDLAIRKYVEEKLKSAGVAELIIKRSLNKVTVEMRAARPGVVIGKGGAGIEEIKGELKKIAKTEVDLKVFEVKRPEIIAKLVAENIASQCERRVKAKVAGQRAIDAAMETGAIKGISVWISGRIGGAEIARTEKLEEGNVSRHSLRADIDYANAEAQVPGLGKHGIKVWINKGEKHTYDVQSDK